MWRSATSFTKHIYDGSLRLASTEDAENNYTYFYYDDADQQIVTVDAESRATRTVYDPMGRPERIIQDWQGGTSASASAPSCSQLLGQYNPATGALQRCYREMDYTATGQIDWVKDAEGNTTKYVYDGHDRLTHTYFPHKTASGLWDTSNSEITTYDDLGFPTSMKTRRGDTIIYNHDALGRLMDRRVPGAPTHSANGRTVSHSYTYDAADRILSGVHDGDLRLSYEYDAR